MKLTLALLLCVTTPYLMASIGQQQNMFYDCSEITSNSFQGAQHSLLQMCEAVH